MNESPTDACKGCDGPIPPRKRQGGFKKIWCSPACRTAFHYRTNSALRERQAELAAARHRETYVPIRYDLTCSHCGAAFVAKRGDAKYCSRPCGSLAFAARRKADGRLKKPASEWAKCPTCSKQIRTGAQTCKPCHLAARAAAARSETRQRQARKRLKRAALGIASNPRWPWTQGDCAGCGSYFVRKGDASPFCSKDCRPQGKAFISKRGRLAIYERDDWTCQLCAEPIDLDAHYLNDWAPSLDHIVPQSQGGTHNPDNLRLAHRWCNSVRGDLTYYTDADLAA